MVEDSVHRVLMTTDTVGGVWTFALDLAGCLAREHGVEVLLATLGGLPSEAQRAEAARIPGLRIAAGEYRLEWMEDPWLDVEQSREWLLRLEREFRPDVIHLNSYGQGVCPFQAATILTAHSCVLSWWLAVKGEAAPARWNRYREEVKAALRSVDVVTVPSHAMGRSLSLHDVPDGAWQVIPNGRPAGAYRRGEKEPFVFTAGRLWDEAKNTAGVARIAGSLSWPVYAAGESRPPAGSTSDPVEFGGCRMTGWLSASEMRDWYARAAIYALPARYEPFGLSVLEAALSGCALVLGDIESLREIWGDSAVFVDPADAGALREALESLIADPARREEYARCGYERALQYDSSRTAAQYFRLYENAAMRKFACVS